MNPDGLRHENEFSRHKLLDAVGDIYTAGYKIQGSYLGIRSGHYMNNLLLKEVFSSSSNYKIIDSLEPLAENIEMSISSESLVS